MPGLRPSTLALVCLVALTACAQTSVTNRRPEAIGRKIPRPDRILVYDFAANPGDLPVGPGFPRPPEAARASQSAEELEVGRKLGVEVATRLVEDIRDMGLPAVRATGEPGPRVGDIALRGYFVSVDEGSALKRVAIGFGSGSAEVKTRVEGYLMTERGPQRVGSGELESGGGKTPGLAVPLAVTIATANPIGLAVGGAVKVAGEVSGRSTIEGAGRRTADEIAKTIRSRFEQEGWISPE